MTRRLGKQTLAGIAMGVLVPAIAHGQARNAGNWSMPGNNEGQTRAQQPEGKVKSSDVAQDFKFLWKLQLGTPSGNDESFSEPLLRQRLINSRGFKDLVFWADANSLYAVDDELGHLEWQKKFGSAASSATGPCSANGVQISMEAPPVINFNAQRKPGTPPPPPPTPTAPNERKLGIKAGTGFFGLQGIYALTGDGYLHEQVLATGDDFAPPVKFLPSGGANAFGMNISGDTVLAVTAHHCGGVANGAWALQMTEGGYPVTSYTSAQLNPLNASGMPVAQDGTAILVTGPGSSSGDAHPNSVIALDTRNGMKVKDWYTPKGGYAHLEHVSPVVFSYKGKEIVIAPGGDGRIVLLDASSLGGSDHKTALFETEPLSKGKEKHRWDGFAAWQDMQGNAWVIASISAPVTAPAGATSNGEASHGGYVAFKLTGGSDKPALTPVWVSGDMVNPAPPVVTNDVVLALAGGSAQNHAVLHVLNAADGKELYSSKDEISTYTGLSGVSFGKSHAYFTDHNHVLYAFGIGMEH